MDVNQDILDLAVQPINDTEVCGINAKYEADYESLESEIGKSQSLSSESTDWDLVHQYCHNILSNISKDFPTACYYAYTLTLKNGYLGMLNGFAFIEKLSETHWDHLFPPVKRLRARQNSAQWLIEKTALYITEHEPNKDDLNVLAPLASTVKNLDFFLADKMSDSAPNFSDLNKPLKRLKEIAKTQVLQQPPAAASIKPEKAIDNIANTELTAPTSSNDTAEHTIKTPEHTLDAPIVPETTQAPEIETNPKKIASTKAKSSSKPSVTEFTGDIQNEQDAKKAFKHAQDILKKLSTFHAQDKASDPKRYRYSRFALWGSLDKLPPAREGKTQLPAPPADKLKKVIDLYEANDYLECIELAEKSADKMPYWFDGNRYIALCLDALGAEYSKAKEALELELKQFLQRVPKIIELQYSNGEPFVTEVCKTWLHSLLEADNPSASSDADDSLTAAITEAKKMALSGKLPEAFNLLHEQPTKTKREKFKVKMACAELACLNGQVKVGIPMLERLVEEVRALTVADWESDFLSKALALLVNAYEKLDDSDSAHKQQQKEAAYDQLCWYNPALISH